MDNYFGTGDVVVIPAPSGGVVTGTPKLVGGIFAIPRVSADEGVDFAAATCGRAHLPKATGVTFAVGDPLYWDVADGNVNTDSVGNLCIGHALEVAGSSATMIVARIIDTPVAAVSSLDTRLDALEEERAVKQMTAAGTQKAMSVSDTYVSFTEDARSLDADSVEAHDTVSWEALVKVDAMNAAGQVTVDLLCGALSIDNVVLATADANDWVKLAGTKRATAVGASSTWEVMGGEGCGSDGGSVTRDTPTYTGGATGPATTSAVVYTLRAKAATGHAGNLVTVKHFKITHHKAA